MSLIISSATGSKELAKDIAKRPGHPDVELLDMSAMPFGDIMLTINGPRETPLVVGVEFKKIGDVLACIQNGRFAAHQLPGLGETYDLAVLLIEGEWRMNQQTGILEAVQHIGGKYGWRPISSGPRKWMYRDLNRWMLVMGLIGGIQVWFTRSRHETVQTLIDLHDLGQKKWNDHTTLRMISNVTVEQLKYREMPDGSRRMRYDRPSELECVAAQLPGLGVERAGAVAKHFRSLKHLGQQWCSEDAWREVKDGKIGKTIAKRLVETIEKEIPE